MSSLTKGAEVMLASSSQDMFVRLWKISPKNTNDTSSTTEFVSLETQSFQAYSQGLVNSMEFSILIYYICGAGITSLLLLLFCNFWYLESSVWFREIAVKKVEYRLNLNCVYYI